MWRDTTEDRILSSCCLYLPDLVLSFTPLTATAIPQSIHYINQLQSNHWRAVTSHHTVTHTHTHTCAPKYRGMPTHVCVHLPLKDNLHMTDVSWHLVKTLCVKRNYDSPTATLTWSYAVCVSLSSMDNWKWLLKSHIWPNSSISLPFIPVALSWQWWALCSSMKQFHSKWTGDENTITFIWNVN